MEGIAKRVLIQVLLVILTIALLAVLFFVGIYVGYVVIGKGPSTEAFNAETWEHILDFMR